MLLVYSWVPGPGGPQSIVRCSTDFIAGQWYHVAASYWSPDNFDLYINNVARSITIENNMADDISMDTNQNLNIGRAPYDAMYFSGVMDDIRIYDRALTIPEIQSLYRANGSP